MSNFYIRPTNMESKDLLRQIRSDQTKLRAVIFLQSAYRGYVARKRVQQMRERADRQETATIFFLQQVENSCDHFYNCQKTSRKQPRSRRHSTASQENEKIEEKMAHDMLEILQTMNL